MPIGTDFVITIKSNNQPVFNAVLEEEIESSWQRALQSTNRQMFNGNILSVCSLNNQEMICTLAEYRHLIAQNKNPELFDYLQIKPLAVSGLFKCKEGIVFGRRATSLTQDAGLWELVPSGGIETSQILSSNKVDYAAALLKELVEETGIQGSEIASMEPLCLVEDTDSHVIDIAMRMECALSREKIINFHDQLDKKEYSELCIVKLNELDSFVRYYGSSMVMVSKKLLEWFLNYRFA